MTRRFRLIALGLLAFSTLPSALLVGAGVIGLFTVPERPVLARVAPPELIPGSRIRPSDEAIKASFEHFAGKPWFAAFAADAEGHWGYATGKHSPEAARAEALAWCGRDCVVMVEYHPEGYRADASVQTVNDEAAAGLAAAAELQPDRALYYALAEDGSWAVQMPEDGDLLPQLGVLNRCREALVAARHPWPEGLAGPQCRLFHGRVVSR